MFSPANTKLRKLYSVSQSQEWLLEKRKIYSFDLLSGHACPFAKDCLSKAVETPNGRKIQDGPHTKFRCFSASQEVLYTGAYNKRSGNFENLRHASRVQMFDIISGHMPKNAGIVRIHVSGDFFSPDYFDAWVSIAHCYPETLFYAYTKSLPYWINRRDELPQNLSMTASLGGRCDDLIFSEGLKYAKVVKNEQEAIDSGMEVDYTDEHAAFGSESFALVIHGTQPKKS